MKTEGALSLAKIVEHLSLNEYYFYIYTRHNNKFKEVHIMPRSPITNYNPLTFYRNRLVLINNDELISLGEFFDKKYKKGHFFYDEGLMMNYHHQRV